MQNQPFKIIRKQIIAPSVYQHVIHAPRIAAKAQAGHFVVLRAAETGERIPVTLVGWDKQAETITIIVQSAGKSTTLFNSLCEGGAFMNVLGPLGTPVEIKNYGTAACIGGGVGIAELLPVARALKAAGNNIISILGARNKDSLILENEIRLISSRTELTTDDGSTGQKGLVTDALSALKNEGAPIDAVFVIGPTIMMKFVAEMTRPWRVKTFASLNPIMLDATGMCGVCRVEIGAETRLACVDGPMFDAHLVNFDSLMRRNSAYKEQETESLRLYAAPHNCTIDAAESA